MDHDQLIDNELSIKLNIEVAKNKGTINLSSIYGSYNYKADIEMIKGEIVKFFCPHCAAQIVSDIDCFNRVKGHPMIPFYLDMGGKVSVCSRIGCKDHKVEFEDLSIALNKLYQEYGFGAKQSKKDFVNKPNKVIPKKSEADEKKEIIESGAFLQAYCPHCKKSLIEDEMLKVKISNGETGYLMLSPYLNVFTSKSTVFYRKTKQ